MKQSNFFLPVLTGLVTIVLGAPEPVRRAITCGAKGYDGGTDGYAYYTNKGTTSACSAACQKDSSKCKSFSVGNGECNLYNVPVAGNFEADASSPYLFYDASCPLSTTTSLASTATLKTTTSTKAASSTTTTTTTIPRTTTLSTTTTKAVTTTTTTIRTTTSTGLTTTTTTASTTKAATAFTTTSTSTYSTTSTPPCPLPTWVIHDFRFFNSSHNLDCAGADHDNHLCYTGLPTQPDGYGPADTVSATVDGIGSCYQSNPGSTPLREVGDGNVVRCSGSSQQLTFYGNSNSASSQVRFDLQNSFTCNGATGYAWASVNVQMNCVYDAGNNATCTLDPSSVSVPARDYSVLEDEQQD